MTKIRFFLFLFFLFDITSTLTCLSQDWKGLYDKAVNQYQAQQYEASLGDAKKAHALSKATDLHSQAYCVQLITNIFIESSNPDEGLSYSLEEISLFEQTEGTKSQAYTEAIRKKAILLQMKGLLKEAEETCLTALISAKESYGETSQNFASLHFFYAQLLAVNGKMQEAKEALNQSLAQLKSFPEASDDYLNTLFMLAEIDRKEGRTDSAEKNYREFLSLLKQNQNKDIPEFDLAHKALAQIAMARTNSPSKESEAINTKLQQLLNTAVDYQNRNELDKSAIRYLEAAQLAQANHLENNTSFSVYLNYGNVLLMQKKIQEASAELLHAKEIANNLYKSPSAAITYLQFALGDLAVSQKNMKAAIEAYQKATANFNQLPGQTGFKYVAEVGRKLMNCNQEDVAIKLLDPIASLPAPTEDKRSSYDEAMIAYCQALIQGQQYNRAITVLNKVLSTIHEVQSKNRYQILLAEAIGENGDWGNALSMLSSGAFNQSLPPSLIANNFYQIARFHQRLGHYVEAEKSYLSSLDQYKKLSTAPSEPKTQVYNSLAILYIQLGNYLQAESICKEALTMTDPSSTLYVSIRQNLATIYEETLNYEEAKKILEEVTIKDKQRLGEHHPDYAISLQNFAAVCQKMNHLTQALELYQQALSIDQENSGAESLPYATKLANLGTVYHELNDFTKARKFLEQSLKIREVKLGKEHPDYVFNEYNLAVLYQHLGLVKLGLPLFQHASSFYLKQINELFPAMSENEKTAFSNKLNKIVQAYLDFVIVNVDQNKELVRQLYNFRLATKALLINSSTMMRNQILSSNNIPLKQQFNDWLHVKEELGELYNVPQEEREQSKVKIDSLQQTANKLEKSLSIQSELFSKNIQHQTTDWKQVKSRLKPDEAAVEIIRLRLNLKNDSIIYAALILKPEVPEPIIVILPNGQQMEGREFNFYYNAIQFQKTNERSYKIYWKQFESYLKESKTIYVSPDGIYNKINLLTLYDTEANQYVIDRHNIRLLSNLKELTSTNQQHYSRNAVLVGYPDYKLGLKANAIVANNFSLASIIGDGIPELPGTQEEVTQINKILLATSWTTKVLLAANASETAIKEIEDVRILHIATHGFFLPTLDETAPVKMGMDPIHSKRNPLLQAGLIMAGAEKYLTEKMQGKKVTEDGILTAYEVMNLNLHQTELVVLSACETSAGEIRNGEGVYGLQRSFMVAGARSLIMSLWKVEDTATREMMIEFYSQWEKTHEKLSAFRNAQLEMKNKYSSPYFWGGFVLMGNN